MKKLNLIFIALVLIVGFSSLTAKDYRFTDDRDKMVLEKLANGSPELKEALNLYKSGEQKSALEKVAGYFSDNMKERYFFDHSQLVSLLEEYGNLYPDQIRLHHRRAKEMMDLYPADSDWNLPMESNSGKMLTPYELRHLSRQHKLVDVAFAYLLDRDKSKYNYMLEMPVSLEKAYIAGTYEKEGNSVFEVFRAGYRVSNWLFIYNLLLNDENFTPEDNFLFVRTFYYHAVDLAERVKEFRYGNHHTKGTMALALVAILFPEFEESAEWLEMAKGLLTEHLQKEVNEDGFQFERSVHYHIGDIDNYFYVYYLSKINGVALPEMFTRQFYKMFEALTVIAHPDKTLPVLQDDTDNPWSYYNRMNSIMALGTVLFEDPLFRNFASENILADKFWFVRPADRAKLESIKPEPPAFLSKSLPATGYYSMRNGWNDNSMVVTVSAGLSDEKPDHQHGDMLGMQLFAFNNVMLPNYQVRYYLEELPYFKNSFAKNICVVDSIPQGRKWKGNKGGSGFGKFEELPKPEVKAFANFDGVDYFEGSVNYEGATFNRSIVFVHDGFVIVNDRLISDYERNYQQIWQGYYSKLSEEHFRSTTADGSGLEIIQLGKYDNFSNAPIVWGKSSILFEQKNKKSAGFVTLLYPFGEFDTRADERKSIEEIEFSNWRFSRGNIEEAQYYLSADQIFSGENYLIALGVISIGKIKIKNRDVMVLINKNRNEMILLGSREFDVDISGKSVNLKSLKKYSYEELQNE